MNNRLFFDIRVGKKSIYQDAGPAADKRNDNVKYQYKNHQGRLIRKFKPGVTRRLVMLTD